MSDYTVGDILFIVFTFGVIHRIMGFVGYLRQRKVENKSPEND